MMGRSTSLGCVHSTRRSLSLEILEARVLLSAPALDVTVGSWDQMLAGTYNACSLYFEQPTSPGAPEVSSEAGHAIIAGKHDVTYTVDASSDNDDVGEVFSARYSGTSTGMLKIRSGSDSETGPVARGEDYAITVQDREYAMLNFIARRDTTLTAGDLLGDYNLFILEHDGPPGGADEAQVQVATIALNGLGEYDLAPVTSSSGDDVDPESGTYGVDALGRFVANGQMTYGPITPDGSIFAMAQGGGAEDGELVFAIKASSTLDVSDLCGYYNTIWFGHGAGSNEEGSADSGDRVFLDGAGHYTQTIGDEIDSGTYDVDSDGRLILDGEQTYGAVSPDGSFILVPDLDSSDDGDMGFSIVVRAPSQGKSLTYTDSDGTDVTVRPSKGLATVHLIGGDISLAGGKHGVAVVGDPASVGIDLLDTSAKSSLSIKTKGGDGLASIDFISGTDPLGKLDAKGVVLDGGGLQFTDDGYVGSVKLAGTESGAGILMEGDGAAKGVSVTLGDIGAGTDITLGSGLKSLKADSWGGSELTAPWASTIKIAGNFGADVTLTGQDAKGVSLKSLKVGGMVDGSGISMPGSAGTVSVGVWDGGSLQADWLKTLTVNGNKKMSLAGDMTDVDVEIAGWDSKGISLSKMTVKGALSETLITTAAGVQSLKVEHWGVGSILAVGVDEGADGWFSGDETGTGGLLKSVKVTSYDTGGADPFGIIADVVGKAKLAGARVASPFADGMMRLVEV